MSSYPWIFKSLRSWSLVFFAKVIIIETSLDVILRKNLLNSWTGSNCEPTPWFNFVCWDGDGDGDGTADTSLKHGPKSVRPLSLESTWRRISSHKDSGTISSRKHCSCDGDNDANNCDASGTERRESVCDDCKRPSCVRFCERHSLRMDDTNARDMEWDTVEECDGDGRFSVNSSNETNRPWQRKRRLFWGVFMRLWIAFPRRSGFVENKSKGQNRLKLDTFFWTFEE